MAKDNVTIYTVTLTVQQLQEIIEKADVAAVELYAAKNNKDAYMTAAEMAKHLNCKTQTVYKKARENQIEAVKFGRSVRFKAA